MACQPALIRSVVSVLETHARLLDELRTAVGRKQVIANPRAARAYPEGYRIGEGTVLAVVRPATLVELWRCARTCVAAFCIIIVQAANTGLTGYPHPMVTTIVRSC